LQAARGHLARGFWDISLDRREQECLRYLEVLAQTKTRSWFHHSAFIVAEVDGRPAAALCGYDHNESGGEVADKALGEAALAMGFNEADLAGMMQRFGPIATCISDPAAGAWIIENVATWPEYRRKGLVDSLLKEMLEIGHRKGHKFGQISVLINNDPAQTAYEKAGFKVADEKRHPDFQRAVGEPGMRRLLRAL
ncbi:MAG: GNAT family N-acetyltransferase, partial [Candidatus Binatus sp.]